jgi:hypothetical protein
MNVVTTAKPNTQSIDPFTKTISLERLEETEKNKSSISTQPDTLQNNKPQETVPENKIFIAGNPKARVGQKSSIIIIRPSDESFAGKDNKNSLPVQQDLVQEKEKIMISPAVITSDKNVLEVRDNLSPTSLNTDFNKVDPKAIVKGTSINKKENGKNHHPLKRFYAGLEVGPDLSSVRQQSIKKIGYGIGMIAGYKLTRKFSIETGLFFDKKYYSTDGKYINTKNINIPAYASITNADGDCNMLEIPLVMSYTVLQRKSSGLFFSAGLSSYIMNRESYRYEMSRYGNQYVYAADYNNKSTSMLAAIMLGAGYTYRFGKKADLRIEPFVKLPVRKIGTGLLPIQSAGINIGIIKTVF